MDKKYFISVSLMTFVIPVIGFFAEHLLQRHSLTFLMFEKWFIFSSVGLRLFAAGIRQSTKPAFTAKKIFHIDTKDCLPIVRELGFANICFGLVGIVSLFQPEWRIVSAFASGIYYLLAALLHIIKKPASANEAFALWTNIIIFGIVLAYFILVI